MGWGKAHTSPEADVASLRAELGACRIEIERLRRHMRLVMPLEHVTPERATRDGARSLRVAVVGSHGGLR